MPPTRLRSRLLYRVGDPVRVRDVYPTILATVVAVGASQVKVSYTDADGMVVARWVAAAYVEQATVSRSLLDL